MKYFYVGLLLVLTSCLDSSPSGVEYPNTQYNASIYLTYTSDPNWSRAVVVSSDKEIELQDGMITILRNSRFPKNRVVFSVDMIPSVFGYTMVSMVRREHQFNYLEPKVGTIQTLEYPWIQFDIGRFNYFDFINEYRSTPPYGVGDKVKFVSEGDTLMAIWE